MILKTIKQNKIDLEDDLFRMPSNRGDFSNWSTRLIPFMPVWLHETSKDRFRVVDGFHIIAKITQENPATSLPAIVFPVSTSTLALWEFRVQKRFLENNLSIFAFIEILVKLNKNYPVESIETTFGSLLKKTGLAKKSFAFEKLQEICTKALIFESFTNLYLLGINEIEQLSTVSESDLSFYSRLFEGLRLKGNKLASMLDLIVELKHGFGITGKELMADLIVRQILNQVPPHQRYDHIKSRLLTLRYPKMNELRQSWNQLTKIIGLPTRIEIKHDPDFESDDLKLIFNASSSTELNTLLDMVRVKLDSTEFKQLFEFL